MMMARWEITCPSNCYVAVVSALEKAEMAIESSEVTKRAENEITLSHDDGVKVLKLVDALEDLDDVVDVYTNADFPDSVYEA